MKITKKCFLFPVLLCLLLLLGLTGCGKSTPKKEDVIKEDLITHAFSPFDTGDAVLKEFAVNRRQTDKEARTDQIWCDVTYENDKHGRITTVLLQYELFDDEGWLLQSVTEQPEEGATFYPLVYPDQTDEVFQLVTVRDNGEVEKADLYRTILNDPHSAETLGYYGKIFLDAGLVKIINVFYDDTAPEVPPSPAHAKTWSLNFSCGYRYRDSFAELSVLASGYLQYNTFLGRWEIAAAQGGSVLAVNPDLFVQTFELENVSPGFGMEALRRSARFTPGAHGGITTHVSSTVRSLGAITEEQNYTLDDQSLRVEVLADGTVEYSIPVARSWNRVSSSLKIRADGSCYEQNHSQSYSCSPTQLAPFPEGTTGVFLY
ncbi:MAG: hypothetical protein IJ347_05725 [Faecalibacterium sp.]|nr:hypothetical protein [Faecalibacterium sp.]